MKKITLILAFLTWGVSSFAQENFYSFSTRTGTYTDLEAPMSINNGTVWQYDSFEVELPFPVDIFGLSHDYLEFDDDEFYFLSDSGDSGLTVSAAYLRDRNFTDVGFSESPISYKVEGIEGSRILKLELKNAGFEMELENELPSVTYANYQIWYYEQDKSIEYHYGPHNITNMNVLNEVGVFVSFLYTYENFDTFVKAGFISESLTNPVYVESEEEDIIPYFFQSVPAANTVYRFTPNTSSSTSDFNEVIFEVYPNPTADLLNISKKNNDEVKYTIYSISGKFITNGTITSAQETVNVEHLASGSYLIQVGSSVKRFIKK